ncbi:MAG: hypothetical protein NZ695_05620 [Dehalococcoidia bacterium]|jgi:hypothetical protein|nr:hypothetical protein [Dehalococcoidia bacterium]MDW8009174.1 hypothetical protein [Chloroflexota bacterium]
MRDLDPLELKAEADEVLERTARRLRQLLQEAVARLDPFPPFPGAFFTYGIEIDEPLASDRGRGCVVLAPDGELYELVIGEEVPLFPEEAADPVATRKEELKPLDLHPREYVLLAYRALTRVVELLLERQEGRG